MGAWIHVSKSRGDYYYRSEEEAIEAARKAAADPACSMRHIYVYKLVAEVDGGEAQAPVTIKRYN